MKRAHGAENFMRDFQMSKSRKPCRFEPMGKSPLEGFFTWFR
jgi:hypothetical protein